jgi:hypothetical protein
MRERRGGASKDRAKNETAKPQAEQRAEQQTDLVIGLDAAEDEIENGQDSFRFRKANILLNPAVSPSR